MDNLIEGLVFFIGISTFMVLIAFICNFFVRRVLLEAIHKLFAKTKTDWDDILIENGVFSRLSYLIPSLVIYFFIIPFFAKYLGNPEDNTFLFFIQDLALAFSLLMVTLSINTFLTCVNIIYEKSSDSKSRPLVGYIQFAKIIITIIGWILIISIIIDKSPVILLSSLGAMTAILMLVFKDTILSLVASIQLTSLDMVRVGDWIEMPEINADGDIIDISLHTVKIQNFDKTITSIPTYKLITNSFKNWRGMSESGGRRIKRNINIDTNSIRFLKKNEIERFKKFVFLENYLTEKEIELNEHNSDIHNSEDFNSRQLTNIGTFRIYVFNYLKQHPNIHNDMTLLVRQLQHQSKGMPLQIYAFTNITDWDMYENIQADIFDHLFAIANEFDLHIYQDLTGSDISSIKK
jgi:miniconductance mechanosensitive channel